MLERRERRATPLMDSWPTQQVVGQQGAALVGAERGGPDADRLEPEELELQAVVAPFPRLERKEGQPELERFVLERTARAETEPGSETKRS